MKSSPRFLSLVDDARQRVEEIAVDQLRAKQGRGESRLEIVDLRDALGAFGARGSSSSSSTLRMAPALACSLIRLASAY